MDKIMSKRSTVVICLAVFFNSLMIIALLCLSSCTYSYNISIVHTEGVADDIVDDTNDNTPTISPVITVPLSPGMPLSSQMSKAGPVGPR